MTLSKETHRSPGLRIANSTPQTAREHDGEDLLEHEHQQHAAPDAEEDVVRAKEGVEDERVPAGGAHVGLDRKDGGEVSDHHAQHHRRRRQRCPTRSPFLEVGRDVRRYGRERLEQYVCEFHRFQPFPRNFDWAINRFFSVNSELFNVRRGGKGGKGREYMPETDWARQVFGSSRFRITPSASDGSY